MFVNSVFKLVRVYFVTIGLYIVLKVARRFIIDENTPTVLKIFLQSFPNFAEAIVGTCTLIMILFWLQRRFQRLQKILPLQIYILATTIAAIYVLLQEFKVHNLGGTNIFDWYDVLFSVLRLITIFLLLLFIKPKLS